MSSKTEFAITPPADLGSARTKLVYLYLASNGTTTITELQRTLDMPKTTLLPILQTLDDEEFLERAEDGISIR